MDSQINLRPLYLLLSLCLLATARADEPAFGLEEFKAGFDLDAGHIVSGKVGENRLKFMHLNRNIVSLEQQGHYGDRIELDAGLMGVLWWPLSIAAIAPPEQRTMRVEPRVSVAKARFEFAPGDTGARVQTSASPKIVIRLESRCALALMALLGNCAAVAPNYVPLQRICKLVAGRLLRFAVISARLRYLAGIGSHEALRRLQRCSF